MHSKTHAKDAPDVVRISWMRNKAHAKDAPDVARKSWMRRKTHMLRTLLILIGNPEYVIKCMVKTLLETLKISC
jgi:hypothetical protein